MLTLKGIKKDYTAGDSKGGPVPLWGTPRSPDGVFTLAGRALN